MTSTLDDVSQVGIFIFGVAALFLVARKNKWGFVLGLAAQPFWYYTAYYHKQWGLMALNIVYTGTWAYGIYEWFYKDAKATK